MRKAKFATVAGIRAGSGSGLSALADVCGKPLIQRVYERTRAATLVDDVLVLTSLEEHDDALVEWLEAHAIPYRRGPSDDALASFLALVDELQPRFVVRVDGDRPFVEADFIDLQLGALRAFEADLVRVGGAGQEELEGTLGGQSACSARALRLDEAGDVFLARHARDLTSQEIKVVEIEVEARYQRAGVHLRVEGSADLERARRIWSELDHERDGLFPLARVLRWVEAHSELARPEVRVGAGRA